MGAAGNGQPQPQPQQPAAEGGPARLHCGVIALTPGCAKVALVRAPPDGGWQFPSAPLPAEAKPGLEAECGVAADVAEQRLGLDVEATLCSQPVITVGGRAALCSVEKGAAACLPVDAGSRCRCPPLIPCSSDGAAPHRRRWGPGRAAQLSFLWRSTCQR